MRYSDNSFQLAATDLSNHLGCAHLTELNRKVAIGEIKKATYYDPALDVLIKRGRDHEAAYVAHLVARGLHVVDLTGKSTEYVLDAMARGVDVLVQVKLQEGQWLGYADILIRMPGKSKFGDWHYEVQDTKLSQNTRAGVILQLCLYTDLLAKVQQAEPERMYVVKPGADFPTDEYRFSDFRSYYELVKEKFEAIMSGPPQADTYPDPVEQCSICNWWQVCDRKRHEDDHLSLVAGMRSMHIVELERQKINTLESFATVESLDKPERGNLESLERKQAQARIQLDGRLANTMVHKLLLPIDAGRGFNRLPEPNPGDVYFDIEGDAFFPDGGLEYVFGYAFREKGELVYERSWAINRLEEKHAFEKFMAFIIARWRRYSAMYIYHFAPYEPSALKRLARVHAAYEKEVDDLLRAERFIDLHAVFKEALLASVETYSLKALEKFTRYTRKVDLRDASSARKSVEIALELGEFHSLSPATVMAVEEYNQDDCLATEALHVWLEDLRNSASQTHPIARPELKTGAESENVQSFNTRAQALFKSLTEKLPEDRTTWRDEHKAMWLLAHQIEYFRREDKSAWWEFYRVHELDHEELLDERKAITGLTFVGELPKIGRERNITHRYIFPAQEVSIDEGDSIIEVKGDTIGTVRAISIEGLTIDIKKSAKAVQVHPTAVHVSERIDPGALATSLLSFAESVDEDGLIQNWPYPAAKDLLMKRAPRLIGGSRGAYVEAGEDMVTAAIRIATNLDKSVFAIQGPPGTGKTYTGANMIVALAKAGKKIGITAVSHKVIRNLSEACIPIANQLGVKASFVHKITEPSETLPPQITEVDKSDQARAALANGSIVCGTAWLWAEDGSREVLDYLFVDEAGQMSLSQVLAASRAAKNLILLGDPQQLEQPQRGAHPEGSDVAALTYLLNGHPTMPEGNGLFLGVTRRLHPAITSFTSELYYEGRLTSLPGLENQVVSGGTPFDGAGLLYVPVVHRGNQNKSPEEVQTIELLIRKILPTGIWTSAEGETRLLTKDDILIVAPYNAQVATLLEQLPGFRIGTVDKFQGQEAPIVIYSMTSSSIEDAPKGMSFLFNPNRLNVATSRAKSVCILVASPKLLEPGCRTIDQMRWANGVCRFVEGAKVIQLLNL
jgi:predicted RecB family nuclease